ncbi:hypothetical protein V6x_52000 [Gimesia chilikensis]|uniref:Uncharacterized protein n=1 Tax=Gimesia chilikensis TaxID=2605989 RepID=A0A517WJQ6_9PLAN|nr:hypothetical protein V6x_52000 [Gimesia chilikensis]
MTVSFSEQNWFIHVVRRVILWMFVLLKKKDFKFSIKIRKINFKTSKSLTRMYISIY